MADAILKWPPGDVSELPDIPGPDGVYYAEQLAVEEEEKRADPAIIAILSKVDQLHVEGVEIVEERIQLSLRLGDGVPVPRPTPPRHNDGWTVDTTPSIHLPLEASPPVPHCNCTCTCTCKDLFLQRAHEAVRVAVQGVSVADLIILEENLEPRKSACEGTARRTFRYSAAGRWNQKQYVNFDAKLALNVTFGLRKLFTLHFLLRPTGCGREAGFQLAGPGLVSIPPPALHLALSCLDLLP